MASIVGGLAVRVVSAVSAVGSFYTEINPATLSGALDIVVVVQQDGSLACSPFHVRFGKLKILRPSEKLVELRIDNEKVSIDMKMGDAGECFFVVKTDANVPQEFKTSPIQKPQIINQVDAFLLDEDIINIKQDVKQENTQNSTIETQYTPTLTHLSTSNQIQLGTSPPGYISWSWGAFPEKQNKPDKDSQHGSERHRDSSENRQNISQFISTPALKLAYEKGAMSSNEKVDNYLNGLEEGLSETHIEVFDQSISTEMSVQRDQSVLTDQSNTSILSIQTDQSTNTVMIQADQSINTVLSVHPARSITTIMSTQADQTSLHDQALPISTQTQYPVEISIWFLLTL
jgi:phosphatidate phosphatase PAH1